MHILELLVIGNSDAKREIQNFSSWIIWNFHKLAVFGGDKKGDIEFVITETKFSLSR